MMTIVMRTAIYFFFFFSSRRRHTRCSRDWSSDVCSSDLLQVAGHDWALLKQRRDAYILKLNEAYAANLARHEIELVRARASLLDEHSVTAAGRRLQAPHIILATGGRPRRPLIPGAELGITSDGFFELPECPRRVAVVGSSYIAVELAGIFAGLGAGTTLVLRGDTALKTFDDMLGEAPLDMLREEGGQIVTHASPPALARGTWIARTCRR